MGKTKKEKNFTANEMTTQRLTDLPLEILSYILSFLPYAALRDVRRVCHRLYNATLDPRILEREIIPISGNKTARTFKQTLLRSKRTFRHFSLENDESVSYNPTFWSHLGPALKSLSFSHCNVGESGLFAILSHCTGLKYLKISSCFVKISAETAGKSLNNNADLKFNNTFAPEFLESFTCSRLDSRIFWKILRCSPNLTSLSVEGILGSVNPLFQNGVECPEAHITIADIISCLKINGHRLLDLRLVLDESDAKYDAHAEMSSLLSQLDNLRLKRFSTNLDLREELISKNIKEFLSKQKEIQSLSLGPLTSDMFDFISREFPIIKDLDLRNVVFVTDSDVKTLTSLINLVSLRISLLRPHRTRWLQYDMYADLCGEVNQTLKVLELPCSRKQILVTRQCISLLTKTYPALTHLNLYGCNALDNISVQTIFRYLLSLESLILRDCWGLSDPGLKGSHIETSSKEDTDRKTGYGITRLKRLRLLDLSCCPFLTGEAFTCGLKLPELRQLFLNHNKIYPKHLMCLFENNPTIERLEIIGNCCMKITDECVHCIVNNLRYLRYITIEGSYIRAECMELLQEHCRNVVTKREPYCKNQEIIGSVGLM